MRPRALVRLFLALLWVSTVSLVCVPALEGATVSMTVEEDIDVTLTFEAAAGEANHLDVTMTTDFGGFIVSETGFDAASCFPCTPLTLSAGPGCTSLEARIAFCEHNVDDWTETLFHVLLDLGDKGDIASASDACGWFSGSGETPPCEVRISAGKGHDIVFMNDGGQNLVIGEDPSNRSVVYGGPGNDILEAGEGLLGAGSRLLGQRGNDELVGGPGRDMISGGGGEDTIRGRSRADVLRGGAGADIFYARDRLEDALFGGKGRDSAHVDRRLDRIRSIERFF